MKGNSKMTKSLAKDSRFIHLGISIEASFEENVLMVRAHTLGQPEKFIKEDGSMESEMDMVYGDQRTETSIWENG